MSLSLGKYLTAPYKWGYNNTLKHKNFQILTLDPPCIPLT